MRNTSFAFWILIIRLKYLKKQQQQQTQLSLSARRGGRGAAGSLEKCLDCGGTSASQLCFAPVNLNRTVEKRMPGFLLKITLRDIVDLKLGLLFVKGNIIRGISILIWKNYNRMLI